MDDGAGGGPRPFPHLVLDTGELEEIRDSLLRDDAFVIDVETTILPEESKGAAAFRNEVLWVGLCTRGQVHLIPTDHPKGRVIIPEHKEKTPAFILYGADDERAWTPGGKPKMALKEHTVPAVFSKPPQQIPTYEVYDILKPLMFSDRLKIGHNLKYDLESSAKYYGGEIPPGPYHDTLISAHILNEWYPAYDLKSLICKWLGIGVLPNILNVFPTKVDGPCNACGKRMHQGDTTILWQEDGGTQHEFRCETCGGISLAEWKLSGGTNARNRFYPNLGKAGVTNFGIEQAARYLAKDVHYDWLYYKMMSRLLRRDGLEEAMQVEMDLYPVVMDIEREGFPVDRSIKDKVGEILKAEIGEIEEKVWDLAGDRFPLSNTNKRRYVLFGESDTKGNSFGDHRRKLRSERLPVIARTPKDRLPQLTQPLLEWYAQENYVAELFLRWSELEKLRGTFIDGLDRWLWDGRIHTSFKQHGTVTSRLSAHEPNLHQLPRGSHIRQFFVAGQGYSLIVSDYDQVELRVMAELAQDQAMIAVFQENRDIHREAAAVMLQVHPDDVTGEQRQVGKTVNFSTGYGGGEKRVAAIAGVPVQTAATFIARYYEEYSSLLPWKARLLKQARKRGDRKDMSRNPPYVEIPPFGRRRRLPDLFNQDQHWARYKAERQAVNAVVQGLAANITKLAMIDLHYDLADQPVKMLVQVHDEIVFRTPEDAAEEMRPLVVQKMTGVCNPVTGKPILGKTPLVASAAVGESWSAAKG